MSQHEWSFFHCCCSWGWPARLRSRGPISDLCPHGPICWIWCVHQHNQWHHQWGRRRVLCCATHTRSDWRPSGIGDYPQSLPVQDCGRWQWVYVHPAGNMDLAARQAYAYTIRTCMPSAYYMHTMCTCTCTLNGQHTYIAYPHTIIMYVYTYLHYGSSYYVCVSVC